MTTSDLKLLSISQINENLENCPDWNIDDSGQSIVKTFQFSNFREAVDFLNEVAKVAEFEGHHPDLRLHGFKNLEIKLTTHSVLGLTQKDFAVASGIDRIPRKNA